VTELPEIGPLFNCPKVRRRLAQSDFGICVDGGQGIGEGAFEDMDGDDERVHETHQLAWAFISLPKRASQSKTQRLIVVKLKRPKRTMGHTIGLRCFIPSKNCISSSFTHRMECALLLVSCSCVFPPPCPSCDPDFCQICEGGPLSHDIPTHSVRPSPHSRRKCREDSAP